MYKELIELGLKTDVVYSNLAAVLGMQGLHNEAAFFLEKSLGVNPVNSGAYNNLGIIWQNKGNLESAIYSYKKSLEIRPYNPEVHNNLGTALKEMGDYSQAISCYEKALSINNEYTDAYYNLGVLLMDQERLKAAIVCYKKTISLKNDHLKAHNNLGLIFKKLDRLEDAIMCYRNALTVDANCSEVNNNLGVIFQELGNFSKAIACYRKAIDIDPMYAEAYCNIGGAYFGQGDFWDGISCLEKAIECKSHYPEAQYNISLVHLHCGNYEEGWNRYEYRLQCNDDGHGSLIAKPVSKIWSNDDIDQAQKLLLVGEKGLGDILHFMRYANALKNKNISISLCAPVKLHGLIKASGIDDSPLSPQQAELVLDEQWLPLHSVPRYLKVRPDNPIITEPYIKTKNELLAKWKRVFSFEKRPIVGINWQGNPVTEKNQLKGRSFPLEAFSPVISQVNVSLLSLQKGFGSEQLQSCTFRECFVKCQDKISEVWDFLETAAIVANCDLVITSDTAVAHLAAGMGKKTWLLLHKVPDWRWGFAGEESFWYPSMRLFRQQESGNWDEVIHRVAIALRVEFHLL